MRLAPFAVLLFVSACTSPDVYAELPGLAPSAQGQPSYAPLGPGPVAAYGAGAGGISAGPITPGPITPGPVASAPVTPAPVAPGLTTAGPAVLPSSAGVADPAAVAAAPGTAPGMVADPAATHAGLSDEQDFTAVKARETADAYRARLEQNRARFQQIAPGALPERPGSQGASPIIDYAINAPNRLGQPIYARTGLVLANPLRACARYATPAEAQEAFLRSGGPRRDPRNLDPDGDGYACSWDPTPFQAVRDVVQGAGQGAEQGVPGLPADAAGATGVGQGG